MRWEPTPEDRNNLTLFHTSTCVAYNGHTWARQPLLEWNSVVNPLETHTLYYELGNLKVI